ncbi:hypothetical protein NG799_13185 [Laspinema sp. D1]|uniref:Uncharacterized protein n=1 Tax=Laspinema palackyanum D2a TaxID=2953684 RepID=A0ABT2MTT3_9CYAN|nr:hypothetical protein [Laspinema sp. D2a]
MEEKLQELAEKYEIPLSLLKEAIEKEKEKIILQNRKMSPILVEMIERYTDSPELFTEDNNGYGF